MKRLLATTALACALQVTGSGLASAQEMYIGETRLVAFNFCPLGWFQASGQLLPISQYTALFALIGTTYGGNGQTNFALPNLNGRAPYGNDPTGSLGQPIGAVYGSPTVTLTIGNLPAHNHTLNASNAAPNGPNPAGNLLPTFTNPNDKIFAVTGSPANVPMAQNAIGLTGQNLPVNVQSPALAMNWCIAWQGIFPSRP